MESDSQDVVWSEDRDENFLKLFSKDIERLENAGFSQKEIKKMICKLDYVRFWCKNPGWLYPVKGLPKGFKWSDGIKFQLKPRGQWNTEKYIFLAVEGDLYISGISAVGTNIKDKPIVKIVNYKSLKANEVTLELKASPFLTTTILNYWKENGLQLGYVESIWREMFERHPKETEDALLNALTQRKAGGGEKIT